MKNQNQPSVKLSQNESTLIVQIGDRTALISTNLIRHLLGISYTKKDGTLVSVEKIQSMKQKAREAYAEVVAKNAKPVSATA